ncbi:MAG: hypothetical protein RI922_1730 [Bacteroidota bacterium]|jgi:hypothetical protein
MRKNTMIGLGAMVLVIISTFLPLIKYAGMDSPSIWAAGENGQTVGIIVMVVSILVGLFSFLANKKHLASIGTLLFSGILILIALAWISKMGETEGAAYGMGLILFLVGTALAFISSILGFMKK